MEPTKKQLIEALLLENPALDYATVELCVDTYLEDPGLIDKFANDEIEFEEQLEPTGGSVTVE